MIFTESRQYRFKLSEIEDSDVLDHIEFSGHENILGTHYNTLEITTESDITKRADCIVGVSASKGCADLSERFKTVVQQEKLLKFSLIVEDQAYSFLGQGSKGLTLSDPKEIVLRRSSFLSPRTAAINCTAAAIDVPRRIIGRLQTVRSRGHLVISNPSIDFT